MEFLREELAHYERHLALPDFSLEQQKRLKAARVLVVGAGGLGCPVLSYLVAAGVGQIGIVDDDRVEVSNLQRQVLFSVKDIAYNKAEAAKARLQTLNPHVEIKTFPVRLENHNVFELFEDYDIIADGTDNFPTRYLINDACVLAGKVNVYASVFRYEGQVSVFNLQNADGSRGPNYRDIYPEPPAPEMVPNCAEGGILGVLAGIIGSMQANEVIKIITGNGEPLSGRLFLFDAADFRAHSMKIKKNPTLSITALSDYEVFCGLKAINSMEIKELSVKELKKMMDEEQEFQLIDVRENFEHVAYNIGGKLIPLRNILANEDLIDTDKKVIIYCRSGKRSATAVFQLQQESDFQNLYNLKGGVIAWRKEIDS